MKTIVFANFNAKKFPKICLRDIINMMSLRIKGDLQIAPLGCAS